MNAEKNLNGKKNNRSDPRRSDRLRRGFRQTGLRFASRSDVLLINIAGHDLTSDRLMGMTPTGGQTEAVRPGYRSHPAFRSDVLLIN
jgi:hypothetical protein